MFKKIKDDKVFYISLAIILFIALWGLILPDSFEKMGNFLYKLIVENMGWFYVLTMTSFIVFAVWIGFFSKYRNIKLGPDDSKPAYSRASWFAMLFSAGMGIGLVFWGIAEPLNHYINPIGYESMSEGAKQFAMLKSYLHWGLHPWANYSILGLGLAYMQFRKNKPGLVSSIFIPLIGEKRAAGWLGKLIDILAIFATAAGMATSLGLGTYQINSGLNFMWGVPETNTVQTVIVVVITIIFVWTAVTGVDKGIKFISNLNMILVVAFLSLVVIVGPTRSIFNTFVESTGLYFQNLIGESFKIGAFGHAEWYGGWTIFYWAWWIAWAPFTGIFIARISRGRTIKEFISGVLLVPAFVSFFWFAVFGSVNFATEKSVLLKAVKSTTTAFFTVVSTLGLGRILCTITIVLLFTFFITSANSATFVLGMLSHKGDLNPPNWKKTTWGIVQSVLALSLMIGSVNGLQMIQTISIVAAFPFTIIMIMTMVSVVKGLTAEFKAKRADPALTGVQQQQAIAAKSAETGGKQ